MKYINILLYLTFPFIILAQNSRNKQDIETFIPASILSEVVDTLITDRQLQITITKTDLESYIVRSYYEDSNAIIDKYRDAEVSIVIKLKAEIILDTVLRKEQFAQYADEDFLDIAILHNYWFNQLNNNIIELFGVINEPETDYALAFYHYFDLTNRKLTFVEAIDDEE